MIQGCATQNPQTTVITRKYLVLLELTSSDCAQCLDIHSIVQDVKPLYQDKMTFVTMDISNESNQFDAEETAQSFHGDIFIKLHADQPGTVAVLNALNGVPLGMLQNDVQEAHYTRMLDSVIANLQKNGESTVSVPN